MTELLLSGQFLPFTFALGLLAGLLVLELVLLLIGVSLVGDAGDIDVAIETPELDALGLDLGGVDLDGFELAEFEAPEAVEAAAPSGIAAWLGLGQIPVIIWVAAVLMLYGLSGLTIQTAMQSALGFTWPALLTSLPAGAVALIGGRGLARVFARVLPQSETSALSERSLGRRRGIITQGTAARGRPAEVRVVDGFGNAHYLRAEPMSDGIELNQGTEVLVLRNRRAGTYHLVAL